MSSVSSIISATAHTAFSSRGVTSTASDELQKLFSKLHMDAIASTGTSSASTSIGAASATSSTSTESSSEGGVTGLMSGLRHLFDGALDAAKDARATAKAVTAYSHGAGIAGLAAQAINKLG